MLENVKPNWTYHKLFHELMLVLSLLPVAPGVVDLVG